MVMQNGEQWHCTNPACHCEVLVQTNGQVDGANPLCACGAPLKKRYVAPHLTYLKFLRVEEPIPEAELARKG